jgi:predicted ATPase/DNA-binding SARP family transcriptional activator/DNA-binding CsgD family transcriptional regulator
MNPRTKKTIPPDSQSLPSPVVLSHDSSAPDAVRIRLLGDFRISVGLRAIDQDAWRLKKAANLIKLLALAPGHRLHRERAMDLLWPELGKKAASNNLRQTLHAARRALTSDKVQGSRYLVSEDESLVLCPQGELWVDVDAFEEAAATARRARDTGAYRAALELYSGELLPGDRYEEWAEGRRQELLRTWLSLHVELARVYEERREYEKGITLLQRALLEEPTNEAMHASLMRLYAFSERRGEALVQYQRLREALSGELDAQVSATTERLREEIAAGRFPPAQATGTHTGEPSDTGKHNLPASRTSFVGREHEMVEIKRHMVMTRLLTLTGAGGSGKTRLALEVARELVGAYPDGVWLAELSSLSDGEFIAHSVADAVGVPGQPDRPISDTLVDALRTKKMLLILDNCEHLIEAVGDLVALLLDACPHLRILATSREALGVVGEVIWPVSLLSVPDLRRLPTMAQLEGYEAVRLFVDRALQRKPAFALRAENAQAVAQICARLEGLPLAIELAAARIKMLPPQALLRRLSDRLKLLTGGPREFSERQRTLRSTIEWSYELLEDDEKALFRRLSVFSGGATLETTEAVCDALGDLSVDALEGASSLLEKSLLGQEEGAVGEPRLVMLETIREYAQERLEQSGEAESIKRVHAEYFLALAEEAEQELIGPREAQWFDRLEEELDNIREALSWWRARGQTELVLRLAGALREFWLWEGLHSEGSRWIESALIQEGRTSAVARAKALGAVSDLAWGNSDLDRARGSAEEGLELIKKAGIEDGHTRFFMWSSPAAFFLNLLARVANMERDYERTAKLGEESLVLNRQVEDADGTISSLLTLALASSDQGDYKRAEKLYAEGLSLARELNSAHWRFLYLHNWGWTSLLGGDHERAAALIEEAVELGRERRRGFIGFLPRALDTLGSTALSDGDLERAKAVLAEGLALSREVGDIDSTSASLEGLACVAGARGEAARAARLFGAALALQEAIGYQKTLDERALRNPYLTAARSQLEKASWEAIFAEGQAMTLEKAVEYALSEEDPHPSAVPVHERSPAADPMGNLTRREREVAYLVSGGLTNRRISEKLFISERTVDAHVRKILKKLDLRSRAQIAARAGVIVEPRKPGTAHEPGMMASDE